MKFQRGFSLNTMMLGGAAVAVLALLAMKIAPEYMEYGTVVKAVKATAADTGLKEASVAQVRASYAKRAEIDNIKSLSEKDLDITKASHHELDGVAGLAALIFPGARTDLSNKAEAGADLNGFLDQCDLCRRKDGNPMPIGFLAPVTSFGLPALGCCD